MKGEQGTGGYGFRVGRHGKRRTDLHFPVDGFDSSLSRSPREEAIQLYFAVAGRYKLVVDASDIHDNRTRFELDLDLGDRDVDWIRLGGERVRISGRKNQQ